VLILEGSVGDGSTIVVDVDANEPSRLTVRA
jgi:hypothetical protein